MKNSRTLITILALISVAGISFGGFSYFHRADSENVYVYNCGIIDFKPTTLTKFCADAEVGVADLEWDTWNAKGASGIGKFSVNPCRPTCTDGIWQFANVNVKLSKSVKDHGKIVLSKIDLVAVDKKNLPTENSPSLEWTLESKPLD